MSVVRELPRAASAAPSDTALVVAARAGEDWAREALYRRHVPAVHGLAFRLLGRDADVDDLVQDAFVAAFSSLDRLNDPALFRAWVSGILVRRTSKALRRRRLLARLGLSRPSEPVDLDALVSHAAPPDVAAELRAVYGALDELPPDLRVALILRRVDGATLGEIAALTGASLATVKRRVHKAEELLAERFGQEAH